VKDEHLREAQGAASGECGQQHNERSADTRVCSATLSAGHERFQRFERVIAARRLIGGGRAW
jgi:hypothetical protein